MPITLPPTRIASPATPPWAGRPRISITSASPATARAAITAAPPGQGWQSHPHQPGLRGVPYLRGVVTGQFPATPASPATVAVATMHHRPGKGNNHLVTNQDCVVCHAHCRLATRQFQSRRHHRQLPELPAAAPPEQRWQSSPPTRTARCAIPPWRGPANFSHAGITGTVSRCHNGTTAQGKGNNHLATNQDCVTCHATVGWTPRISITSASAATARAAITAAPPRQGRQSHSHQPGLRGVPCLRGVVTGQFQPRRHHRQPSQLPQWHHRPGQGNNHLVTNQDCVVCRHCRLATRQFQSRRHHRQPPELP